MKKDVIIALVLLLVGLVLGVPQAEAGRLNFMLINMTNDVIVDISICPTYAQKKWSKNLLNTRVEPNTRIYIGPNLYGHQRYWNIKVTWASGCTQTFTHNRLTKYNTYLVYALSGGFGIRQCYERAFARYKGIPALTEAERPSCVGFGIAEKENVAEKSLALVPRLPKADSVDDFTAVAFNFCDTVRSSCVNAVSLYVVAGIHSFDISITPSAHAQFSNLKEAFALSSKTKGITSRIEQIFPQTGDKHCRTVCQISCSPSSECLSFFTAFSKQYRSPPSLSRGEFLIAWDSG